MLDLLNGFVAELRNAGLPVSLTENLDAMEAVQKSLEQLAKRAPGLHSASSSAKAAATTPTVHDSIDRLIARIEAAKAAAEKRKANRTQVWFLR